MTPLGTVTLVADLPAKKQSYGLFKANAGPTRIGWGIWTLEFNRYTQYIYISLSNY